MLDDGPMRLGGAANLGLGDRTGSPLSGGAGCSCHGGASYAPSITVEVKDAFSNPVTVYQPGQGYTIEYTLSATSGSPGGYGFQSVAISNQASALNAGSMGTAITPNTQISNSNGRQYAEHNGINNAGVFIINWTAPAAGFGTVNIHSRGIAVDGFGSTGGDQQTASVLLSLTEQCVNTVTQDVQSSCTPFTWIDGITYSSSNNTASVTLTSIGGCDSIVNLDLTINAPTAATDVQSACDSYTWIDGQTYTASNNSATVTLTNAAGCDSVVTLDLNITNSTAATDVQSACDSYTWIDGQTYTASNNTATVTLTNAAGCDSVVTLDLTINTVSDNTVAQNGATLTANNGNATYQWVDCDNGNYAIPGANSQVYTAFANGNYAVVLTENGCTDTSACVQVSSVSTTLIDGTDAVSIYPNPTTDNVNINFSSPQTDIQLRIYDALGQLVLDKRYTQRDLIQVALPQVSGLYLLELQTDKGSASFRVVKE